MIKELTILANRLDAKGLHKEADYLDKLIRKQATGYYPTGTDLRQAAHLARRAYETYGATAAQNMVRSGTGAFAGIGGLQLTALLSIAGGAALTTSGIMSALGLNPTASGKQLDITDVGELDLSWQGMKDIWKDMTGGNK